MPYNVANNQKSIVTDLRRKGFSYSEIARELALPKSTLSSWLKRVPLTDEQKNRLIKKRQLAARENGKKRIATLLATYDDVWRRSARDIKKISPRELWLMGIVLYGREKRTVQFTSSDALQIKLFLRWLYEIGNLGNNELAFDIFITTPSQGEDPKRIERAIAHWMHITGMPKKYFTHIYRQRQKQVKDNFGQLRIRVKASSILARQISGWTHGIASILNIV